MARTRCSSTSLAGWCGDETRTGVHHRRSDHRDHGAHRRAAGPDQQLGPGDADDRAGATLRGRGQRRGSYPRQPAGRGVHGAEPGLGGGVARRHAGGLAQLALHGRHDQSLAPGPVVQVPDAAEPMAPRQHGDLHLMSALTRRGFTMVELLIALVILGIVSAALYKVLVTNQRTYLAQTQRIDLQQNIRAAATILPAELREINAAGTAGANNGDLSGMLSTSLTIRAPRQLGFLCVTPPLVGPLPGPNGLTFNYYDANGVVTTDSSKVAQIEIRVRGRTQSPISQPGAAGVAYKIDSVVTRVAIRGNTRCNPCL